MQLTSSADYWPVYSSDGATLIFSRDAFSPDADDNAATPVDPQDDDVDELWTIERRRLGCSRRRRRGRLRVARGGAVRVEGVGRLG